MTVPATVVVVTIRVSPIPMASVTVLRGDIADHAAGSSAGDRAEHVAMRKHGTTDGADADADKRVFLFPGHAMRFGGGDADHGDRQRSHQAKCDSILDGCHCHMPLSFRPET
ncbi:hypothetical protein ACVWWQ_002765 [Rhodanobacter sp. TND4EL1]